MSSIALIPTKSKSRRLPGKNTKCLAGIPLFLHSVRVALQVDLFDTVYVSSDSPAILDIAEKNGASGLLRTPDLCRDDIPNFRVLQHHLVELRALGNSIDVITLLQPTSPFRDSSNLSHMLTHFSSEARADSLITTKSAPRLRGVVMHDRWVPNINSSFSDGRIQSNSNFSEFTGHVVMLRPHKTLDHDTLLGNYILNYPLPDSWPDIDIDTPLDWHLAEAYVEYHKSSSLVN